jgi:hypothetical protein
MRISTLNRTEISNRCRLDSSYYLSEGNIAVRLVETAIKNSPRYINLGDTDIASVWQPNRNILVYAGNGEESVPYLQPYDILEYLPEARAQLSLHQNPVDKLKVPEGTILQTCSGRNLGPLVISDKYLEKFVFGSDLMRITIHDSSTRFYVYSFLNTWVGQALLHSSKTGSVIDHLSADDIRALRIPVFSEEVFEKVSSIMRESYELFSEARLELVSCKEEFLSAVNVHKENTSLCKGWNVQFKNVFSRKRIDAAFYDWTTFDAVKKLREAGGYQLSTVAKIHKPGGRNKTNYVEKEYGLPILSGRQLLQNQTVGLKYLPKSSAEKYSSFSLKKGWIAYPADGRVEGRLGTPVLITDSRDGWFASGHVGRIEAHADIHPGYLYLAFSHPIVQAQLSAVACGSVVDAVYPEDVEKFIVPPHVEFNYDRVTTAWAMIDKADSLRNEACKILLQEMNA